MDQKTRKERGYDLSQAQFWFGQANNLNSNYQGEYSDQLSWYYLLQWAEKAFAYHDSDPYGAVKAAFREGGKRAIEVNFNAPKGGAWTTWKAEGEPAYNAPPEQYRVAAGYKK